MSVSGPIVWVNVTTSSNWTRPPVGIVRVERSILCGLERIYGDRLRRCIWEDGRFVECSESLGEEQHDFIGDMTRSDKAGPNSLGLPWVFPLLPRRQAAISVAQGFLSLLPSKLQPLVNKLLHGLRPWVLRFLARGRGFRNNASRPFESVGGGASISGGGAISGQSIFSPGDVLVSVGLDWDYCFYKEFYFLRRCEHIKIVTCCYDLIPVIYPQYCVGDVSGVFTSYFMDVADGSDLVLCISRQSEDDLLEMLDRTGAAKPMTHVFQLGDNAAEVSSGDGVLIPGGLSDAPFILYVSTIERRKNHEVLYRAYHLLCKEGKQAVLPKLVFVGMQGWGVVDLMKDIELDPLTKDMIVILNHVSDDELRVLYSAALFCVFPSLYEGWGLPVGEALSFGKPVLSSGRGSLPEVGGDLVRYVDPWNPRAWADEIYRMATDGDWRDEWSKKARDQYVVRTWDKASESVSKAIDSLF